MTWENIQQFFTITWVLGLGIFILWCVVAFALKAFIFGRLRRYARKTATSLDITIIEALSIPLNIVIVFAGLSIVWKFVPANDAFEYYMNLLSIIVIIMSVTIFVDRMVDGLLAERDQRTPHIKLSKGVIGGLIRGVIYLLGIFMLLGTLGVNISPLIASLGIGTLAVALALQTTLANFFSGLFVMMDKSINIGDFVQLESGEMGYVDEIGWRASRIRLLTNNHVIIPNSKLVDSIVTNYQAPQEKLYLLLEVGVHYDSDLEHVERVALEAAREIIAEEEGTIKDFEPSLWFREFGDSSITFRLRVGCKDFVSQFRIQHQLIKRIHRKFAEEGIVIPFPLRTVDFQPKHIKMFRELAGKE